MIFMSPEVHSAACLYYVYTAHQAKATAKTIFPSFFRLRMQKEEAPREQACGTFSPAGAALVTLRQLHAFVTVYIGNGARQSKHNGHS